ncbi:flagellar protein, partial [Corallococcus sp. AB018]
MSTAAGYLAASSSEGNGAGPLIAGTAIGT